jgi:hypothetical protein
MSLLVHRLALPAFVANLLLATPSIRAGELPWILVSPDGRGFVAAGGKFSPFGFNYDRDARGRLLEDFWESEWPRVEKDFRSMRQLGANVVRIHLQFAKFMLDRNTPNGAALERLGKLLDLAQRQRLYLDLTGLGCYHKKDVRDWYDALSESDRWDVQAVFWSAISLTCRHSSAVFCYDLMNEPFVPGGKRRPGDWLGPPFGDKYFVQMISLDQAGRSRPDIAKAWIKRLTAAIRQHDRRHLSTVGLVAESLDRPGISSGFVPQKIASELDFLCVHLYPEKGKIREALQTLADFAAADKPVVIEETFPLKCGKDEFERFAASARKQSAGLIGFYWGQPPEELRKSRTIGDAITLQWLEWFQKEAAKSQAR